MLAQYGIQLPVKPLNTVCGHVQKRVVPYSYQFKFKLIYYWTSVGQPVLVSSSHLEPMTRFLFSVWLSRVSWCGAPSLTRGWVCNLLAQLLLDLDRAVTLGPISHRTHDHILLSHLRLPQPGGPGPRIYIPPEQGGPVIPPGTWFPFCRLLRLAGLRRRYSKPPAQLPVYFKWSPEHGILQCASTRTSCAIRMHVCWFTAMGVAVCCT
jgi:hypothetical protein